MRFSVLGAGGWGTAVARLLANNSHNTILWARNPDRAAQIARNRENKRYLPGILLPTLNLRITADLEEALDADAVFLAVPSFAIADLLKRLACLETPKTVINLAKGLDRASHRTISALIGEHLPEAAAFTLSGPSHAEEVGRDMPTAVVLAGSDPELGAALQREIATSRFRIYLSNDIRGVELCATVKNIIAIATGISDGLGYGDNSRG
ncbi:glycerol-3-phosphate dehydrogenase, partial [Candidatus Acetothermia bacterium]